MDAAAMSTPIEIEKALAIIERLYASDKERYQPLYACVYKAARMRIAPALILRAVERIAQKENGDRPALDLREYFFATARKLEEEKKSVEYRKERGGENFLKEFTARIKEAAEAVNAKANRKRRDR
jgi:hypothetical protein